MKRGLKGLIVTTLISFGITSIPLARAAHATNFLDALHAEITNRIANLDTNSTARDKRVLKSARAILEHNTRTFATDLSALARAAAGRSMPRRGPVTGPPRGGARRPASRSP